MPPLSPDGSSLLWEAIGRKFFNMEYWEADKLSQTNKEFIMNFFLKGRSTPNCYLKGQLS